MAQPQRSGGTGEAILCLQWGRRRYACRSAVPPAVAIKEPRARDPLWSARRPIIRATGGRGEVSGRAARAESCRGALHRCVPRGSSAGLPRPRLRPGLRRSTRQRVRLCRAIGGWSGGGSAAGASKARRSFARCLRCVKQYSRNNIRSLGVKHRAADRLQTPSRGPRDPRHTPSRPPKDALQSPSTPARTARRDAPSPARCGCGGRVRGAGVTWPATAPRSSPVRQVREQGSAPPAPPRPARASAPPRRAPDPIRRRGSCGAPGPRSSPRRRR